MREKARNFILGMVIGTIATSGAVFAKQLSEKADLFYNNIKIYIDGGELIPKDPNGNIVEPFIVNGTTYLPIRAVSNAFGKDVEWDGATASVYIGKKDQTKPDNYLDRIQYTDFKAYRGNFYKINGTVTDFLNNTYTNGIILNAEKRYIGNEYDDYDNGFAYIDYPLNSQYKKLLGKIVLPKTAKITGFDEDNMGNEYAVDVMFYGDGRLLYKATNVTNTMPFNFDINVSGVNTLKLIVSGERGSYYWSCTALTDLALYK